MTTGFALTPALDIVAIWKVKQLVEVFCLSNFQMNKNELLINLKQF